MDLPWSMRINFGYQQHFDWHVFLGCLDYHVQKNAEAILVQGAHPGTGDQFTIWGYPTASEAVPVTLKWSLEDEVMESRGMRYEGDDCQVLLVRFPLKPTGKSRNRMKSVEGSWDFTSANHAGGALDKNINKDRFEDSKDKERNGSLSKKQLGYSAMDETTPMGSPRFVRTAWMGFCISSQSMGVAGAPHGCDVWSTSPIFDEDIL